LELSGAAPEGFAAEMSTRLRFFDRYLIAGESPAQIAASDATLGGVWTRIVCTSASGHYGRPFACHQQAQRADWAAAWARVRAPVLAMYGEFDWFESRDATMLITRIVNAKSARRGTYAEIPRMNHHFEQFRDAQQAYRETDGTVNPEPAVQVMLNWLRSVGVPST
jgi:pimeloyl-ACP methyl ester carboxylesterase